MTAELIISIIGQIATIATVLLVYLTLKEMEKQRLTSQKPDLLATRVDYRGYLDAINDLRIASRWECDQESENKKVNGKKYLFDREPFVCIYNIGAGAAKEINIKWDYSLEKSCNFIEEYCKQNSIPIKVKVENEILMIESDRCLFHFNLVAINNSSKYFLLPSSINPEGLKLEIPEPYLMIFSILSYFANARREHQGFAMFSLARSEFYNEIPHLCLEISYSDISGNTYVKRMEAKHNTYSREDFLENMSLSRAEPIYNGYIDFQPSN